MSHFYQHSSGGGAHASSSTNPTPENSHIRHRHDRLSLGTSADLGVGTSKSARYSSESYAYTGPDEEGGSGGTRVKRRDKSRRKKDKDGARRKRTRLFPWTMRRGWVQEAFRLFGEHCARNQIRTLLIDCVVMTNLFYPSLQLYLSKRPSPPPSDDRGMASFFSTPMLDNFFPYPPPLLPRLEWGGWWALNKAQLHAMSSGSGSTTWVSVPAPTESGGGEEAVEWVRIAWADVGDVLDRDSDASAARWSGRDGALSVAFHRLVEDWGDEEKRTGAQCVRRMSEIGDGTVSPKGPCYIVSPDIDPTLGHGDFMSLASLSTVGGIDSISVDISTEGRESDDRIYHTLAVPFRLASTSAASRAAFLSRWDERLGEVAQTVDGEVFVEAKDRTNGISTVGSFHVSLSTDELSLPIPRGTSNSPPRLVLVLYAILLLSLLGQLSNATKVHSRFGLAFTGIVQITCSSVMSFSVLALLGWNGWGWSLRENVLPTYVLPFVIVVVGAENMSALTKAVFSVPFTYPVPVRIGIGLSKAGSTIALASMADILLLGIGWLCVNLPPVREFCIFAAVVIITDWFMLHTFFLTVLSIDAQRLELADVLAANDGLSTSEVRKIEQEEANLKTHRFSWRQLLRARTAKSLSLILLLVAIALMYYFDDKNQPTFKSPALLYGYVPSPASLRAASSSLPSVITSAAELVRLSPAETFWRALNPRGWPSMHVTVSPTSIIVLPRAGHSMLPADIRKLSLSATRLLLPRLKPIFVGIKVILLPQLVSLGALWILLRYLLKDADLLDAQRDRLGRGEVDHRPQETGDEGSMATPKAKPAPSPKSTDTSIANTVGVHMLPCTHESDVDVIAASEDGKFVVSIGVDNSVVLWRFDESETSHQRVSGTREVLQSVHLSPSDPIVAAAVSVQSFASTAPPTSSRISAVVAVATASDLLQTWNIPEHGRVQSASPCRVPVDASAAVLDIAFDTLNGSITIDDPFTAQSSTASASSFTDLAILVAMSNGAVLATDSTGAVATLVPASKGVTSKVQLILRTDGVSIFTADDDEGLKLWRRPSTSMLSEDLDPVVTAKPERVPVRLISTLEASDKVTAVAMGRLAWYDTQVEVVVVGRKSGSVELFSATTGHIISVISVGSQRSITSPRVDVFTHASSTFASQGQSQAPNAKFPTGAIRRVGVSCPTVTRCTTCDYPSTDGFFVVFSTSESVYISRILPRGTVVCRCAQPQTRRMTSSGSGGAGGSEDLGFPFPASRGSPARSGFSSGLGSLSGPASGGGVGSTGPSPVRTRPSPGGSPKKSPGLLPLITNSDFPISSHGGRRSSAFASPIANGGPSLAPAPIPTVSLDSAYPNGNGTGNAQQYPPSPLDRPGASAAMRVSSSNSNSGASATTSASGASLATPGSFSGGAGGGASNPASTGDTPGEWQQWMEAEVVPLGSLKGGSWALVRPTSAVEPASRVREAGGDGDGELLIGLRREGNGIDDAQWAVWVVDLARAWDGSNLVVDSAGLGHLERRTRLASSSSTGGSKRRSSTVSSLGLGPRRSSSLRRGSIVASVSNLLLPQSQHKGAYAGQSTLAPPSPGTSSSSSGASDAEFVGPSGANAWGGRDSLGDGDAVLGSGGEMSLRAARAERILSLDGRASFPAPAVSGQRGASTAVPTHVAIGYVRVHPFDVAAPNSADGRVLAAFTGGNGGGGGGGTGGAFGAVIAGFGNRVGVIVPPTRTHGAGSILGPSVSVSGTASASTSASRILRARRSTSQSFQMTQTPAASSGGGGGGGGGTMSPLTPNMATTTPTARRLSAYSGGGSGGGVETSSLTAGHVGLGVGGLGIVSTSSGSGVAAGPGSGAGGFGPPPSQRRSEGSVHPGMGQ